MDAPSVNVAELIQERDMLRAALLQTVLAVKDTALLAVLREEAERKFHDEQIAGKWVEKEHADAARAHRQALKLLFLDIHRLVETYRELPDREQEEGR